MMFAGAEVVSRTFLVVSIFLITAFLLLLLREVNCWYWKINERLTIIKESNEQLKLIVAELKELTSIYRGPGAAARQDSGGGEALSGGKPLKAVGDNQAGSR